MENTTEKIFVPSEQIGGYNIKGMWYFDKKYSELKYRLLGLAPVAVNPRRIREFESNLALLKGLILIVTKSNMS